MVSQIIAWPPEAMAVIDDLSRKCLFQRKLIIQMRETHIAERDAFVEKFRQYREQTEEHIKQLQTSYAETLLDLISNREDVLTQLQPNKLTSSDEQSESAPTLLLQDDQLDRSKSNSYQHLLTSLRKQATVGVNCSTDGLAAVASLQRLDAPLSKIQEQFITSLLQQEFNDQIRCIAEEYRLLLRELQDKCATTQLSFDQLSLALKAKDCENAMLRRKLRKYVMMDGGLRTVGTEIVDFNSIVSNTLFSSTTRQQQKDMARAFSTKKKASPPVMGRPATVDALLLSEADVGHHQKRSDFVGSPAGPIPKHDFHRSRCQRVFNLYEARAKSNRSSVPANSLNTDLQQSSIVLLEEANPTQSGLDNNAVSSQSTNNLSQSNTTIIRYPSLGTRSSILFDDLQPSSSATRASVSRCVTVAVGDEIPHISINVTIFHDFDIQGEKVVSSLHDDPLLTCPNPYLKSSTDSIRGLSNPSEHVVPQLMMIKDCTRSILLNQTNTDNNNRPCSATDSCDKYDDTLTTFGATQTTFADAKAQRLRIYNLMYTAAGKEMNMAVNMNSNVTSLPLATAKLIDELSIPPAFTLDGSANQTHKQNKLETGLLLQVQKCTLNVENDAGHTDTRIFYDKKIHTSVLPFLMSTNVTHRQLLEKLNILEKRRKECDSELVNSHTLMNAAIAERKEAVQARERIERQLLAIIKERDVLIQSYENKLLSLKFNLQDVTERMTALHKESSELSTTLQMERERYSLLDKKYEKLSLKVREDVIAEMKQIENATIGHLQADIVFYKDNLQLSEERIVELASINSQLEQINSELKVDVLKQTLYRDRLKEELRSELVIDYNRQIRFLEEQLKQDSEQYNAKVKEVGDLTDAIYRLRSDVDFLTEENANMHISMHSLNTEMADIVQKYHTVESDRRSLYARHTKLQQEFSTLQEEKNAVETELKARIAEQEEREFGFQQVIDAYRIKYLLIMKRTSRSIKDKETLCLAVENVQNHANEILFENKAELNDLNAYSSRLKETQKEIKTPNICSFDSFSFTQSNSTISGPFPSKHINNKDEQLRGTSLAKNILNRDNLHDSDFEGQLSSLDASSISDVMAYCQQNLCGDDEQQDDSARNALIQYRQGTTLAKSAGVTVSTQLIGLTYTEPKAEVVGGILGVPMPGVSTQTDDTVVLRKKNALCQTQSETMTVGLQTLSPFTLLSSDADLLAEAYDQVEKLRAEKKLVADSHSTALKTVQVKMNTLETELLSKAHMHKTLNATISDLTQKLEQLAKERDDYQQKFDEISTSSAALINEQSSTLNSTVTTVAVFTQNLVNTVSNKCEQIAEKLTDLHFHLALLTKVKLDSSAFNALSGSTRDAMSNSDQKPSSSFVPLLPVSDKYIGASTFSRDPHTSRSIQVNTYCRMPATKADHKDVIEYNLNLSGTPSTITMLESQFDPQYKFSLPTDVSITEPQHSANSTLLSSTGLQSNYQFNDTMQNEMHLLTNTLLSTITDETTHASSSLPIQEPMSPQHAMQMISTSGTMKLMHRSNSTPYPVTYQTSEKLIDCDDQACYAIDEPFLQTPVKRSSTDHSSAVTNTHFHNTASFTETSVNRIKRKSEDNALSSLATTLSMSPHSSSSSDTHFAHSSFKEMISNPLENFQEDPTELHMKTIDSCYLAEQKAPQPSEEQIHVIAEYPKDLAISDACCKSVLTTDIELNMLRLANIGNLIVSDTAIQLIPLEEVSHITPPPDALLNLFDQEAICKYCGSYKDIHRYIDMDIANYATALQNKHNLVNEVPSSSLKKPTYLGAQSLLETFEPEKKAGFKVKQVSFSAPLLLDRYAHYPLMASSMLLKQNLKDAEDESVIKKTSIGSPVITTRKLEYLSSLNAYVFSHDPEREADKLLLEDHLSMLFRQHFKRQKLLLECSYRLPLQIPSTNKSGYTNKRTRSEPYFTLPDCHTIAIFDTLQDKIAELQKMNSTLLFDNKALQIKLCEDEKIISLIFGRNYNFNITAADILLGRPINSAQCTKEDYERYRLVLKETLLRYRRPKTAGSTHDSKLFVVRPLSAQLRKGPSIFEKISPINRKISLTHSAIHTIDDLVHMSKHVPTSSPVRDAMSFSHYIAPHFQYFPPATSLDPHLHGYGSPISNELPNAAMLDSQKPVIVRALPIIPTDAVILDPPPLYEDGTISRVSHAFIRRPAPPRGCSASIQNIPPILPPSASRTPKKSHSKPLTSLSVFYRGISPNKGNLTDSFSKTHTVSVDNPL